MSSSRPLWLFCVVILWVATGCSGPGADDDSGGVDDASAPGTNASPEATITSPFDDDVLSAGVAVTLTGEASDAETAPSLLSAVWSSDVEGKLGEIAPDSLGGISLEVTFAKTGSQVLTLTVTDGDGASAEASVSIFINAPPTAQILDADPRSPSEGDTVTFTGTVSDAEDSPEDLAIAWTDERGRTLGTDPADSGGNVTLLTDELTSGPRTVILTATDSEGAQGSASFKITIAKCTDQDGDGSSSCDGDCDDKDPTKYPGAVEICDGLDQDCDGEADDGFSDTDWDGVPDCLDIESCDGLDNDGDGQIDEGFDQDKDGVTICEGDCNDGDPLVYEGANELCDGKDQNCDGIADTDLPDTDGDGILDCKDSEECDGIDNDGDGLVDEDFDKDNDGYTVCMGDCNDTNPAAYPDAIEVCDGVDGNCDGMTDLEFDDTDGDGTPDCIDTETCDGLDNDGDGQIDEGFDKDFDGFTQCLDDCDDTDPDTYPGADEICDGVDQNCDGTLDTEFPDGDGDGIPDCLDTEECDGIDNDGDGEIDEGFDEDGDGVPMCQGDCDDALDTVYPGADEVCDASDNDCDSEINEDQKDAYEPDNSLATAYDLGDHNGTDDPVTFSINGNTHALMDSDWYKVFVLDDFKLFVEEFYLKVTLKNIPAGVNLDLYLYWDDPAVTATPEQQLYETSKHSGNADEELIHYGRGTLEDGGYYWIEVRWVSGYDCSSNYTLAFENMG